MRPYEGGISHIGELLERPGTREVWIFLRSGPMSAAPSVATHKNEIGATFASPTHCVQNNCQILFVNVVLNSDATLTWESLRNR